MGNPNQWFANCGVQDPSPNNNPATDSMATFVAHELEESFTDPDGNAWCDVNGNENPDKCVWTFGCSLPGFNGNWVNAKGGYCA